MAERTGVYIHMDCLAAMLLWQGDPGGSVEAQSKAAVCSRCVPHQYEAERRRTLLMDMIEESRDMN